MAEQLPPAWLDLMGSLALLAREQTNAVSPFNCTHDTLTVMSDPDKFSPEELAHLEAAGFLPGEEGTFYSFRYGSA